MTRSRRPDDPSDDSAEPDAALDHMTEYVIRTGRARPTTTPPPDVPAEPSEPEELEDADGPIAGDLEGLGEEGRDVTSIISVEWRAEQLRLEQGDHGEGERKPFEEFEAVSGTRTVRRRRRNPLVPRPKTVVSAGDVHRGALKTVRGADHDDPRPRIRSQCEPCDVCQAYANEGLGALGLKRQLDPFQPVPAFGAGARLICGHLVSEVMNHCRPCAYVGCRHHMYLDVNPETGAIRLTFPDVEPWELKISCSLDIADQGGITLEEVGTMLNVSRERIRQVEVTALLKARFAGVDFEDPIEEPVGNED